MRLPQYFFLEINRLATDGTKNACSKLYGASAAIGKLMGFTDIETAILETEPGTSLKAAGFTFRRWTRGGDWNRPSRAGRRTDQPMGPKQIWGKALCPVLVYTEDRERQTQMSRINAGGKS